MIYKIWKEPLIKGLDAGLTANEIKEILVQMYAYCGFPRSLNALNTFMKVADARKDVKAGSEGKVLPKETDKFAYGDNVQVELTGGHIKGGVLEFAPAIDQYLKEHLFADIFARGVLTILFVAGFAYAITQNNKGDIMDNKKILVAYFSWGGNTKFIAEKIHSQVGGDMFRIETAVPYPTDYNEAAYGVAKKQHDENIHPELKDNDDVSEYDVIFVGTPAWWYTMAPAVMTFLEVNNFEGKTIVPFITHGGGGKYNIAQEMGQLAKGAKVLTPFIVYGKGDSQTDKELENWLKKL